MTLVIDMIASSDATSGQSTIQVDSKFNPKSSTIPRLREVAFGASFTPASWQADWIYFKRPWMGARSRAPDG